ncbi:MAG: hypothetical protein RLZZ597_2656 [Cyanobacteriota bacterium]|jgi:hypothetical protein
MFWHLILPLSGPFPVVISVRILTDLSGLPWGRAPARMNALPEHFLW